MNISSLPGFHFWNMTVVPLNTTNYPTWKLHCRMALMKEGLWRIVTSQPQETAPTGSETERAKFAARWDRSAATVVLTVVLIGDPEDPVVV